MGNMNLTVREQARLCELRKRMQEIIDLNKRIGAAMGRKSREFAQAEERLRREEKEFLEFVFGVLSARKLAPGDYIASPDRGRVERAGESSPG